MRLQNTRSDLGFTLIELMIVVAVIGILAAIATPNYQQYVKKSRRTDAQGAMLDLQQKQEKWRINNPSYGALSDIGGAPPNSYYTFSVSGNTATAYTITATANSGGSQATDSQDGATCSPMTIDANGTKTPPACWAK